LARSVSRQANWFTLRDKIWAMRTQTINSLPRYVVDASVATKWHLKDEQLTGQADGLLAGFRDGRWNLWAPENLRYEVSGAIRKAVVTHRLTREQGRDAIAAFLVWKVPVIANEGLLLAAYDYSWTIGCSIYDGLYLALSDSMDCPFIYADLRLRNAIGTRFPRAVWLEDWVPDTTDAEQAR
jgi:predicted nucleic acid-binding protein